MTTQTVRSCPLSVRDARRYLRRYAAPTNGAATDRATSDAAQQNGKCERFGFLQPWFVEAHRRMTWLTSSSVNSTRPPTRSISAAAASPRFFRTVRFEAKRRFLPCTPRIVTDSKPPPPRSWLTGSHSALVFWVFSNFGLQRTFKEWFFLAKRRENDVVS